MAAAGLPLAAGFFAAAGLVVACFREETGGPAAVGFLVEAAGGEDAGATRAGRFLVASSGLGARAGSDATSFFGPTAR
jgi:hypothetical protein